jgi:hypothetical protein
MAKRAKVDDRVEKSAAKSARRVVGRPFQKGENGGGRGPKKGEGGRPPEAWKAACRELASRPAMLTKAREVLAQPDHPAWLGAWKFLAEQGYGKAAQPLQHDGDVTLTVRFAGDAGD